MMVKVSISDKRSSSPQKINLGNEVTITSGGAIKVNRAHFFPSSFQIRYGKIFIYIDPVEMESKNKADYIFITHDHPDHLSLKTIEHLKKPETMFICAARVAKKLANTNYTIKEMLPGDILKFDQLQCEAVPAYNKERVFLWIKAHAKSRQYVGYIITLDNGVRIYHAGDTDFIREMARIPQVDVALLPIGGDRLTMDARSAAKMINLIKPKVVIPMHYELAKRAEVKTLRNLVDDPINIQILDGMDA